MVLTLGPIAVSFGILVYYLGAKIKMQTSKKEGFEADILKTRNTCLAIFFFISYLVSLRHLTHARALSHQMLFAGLPGLFARGFPRLRV